MKCLEPAAWGIHQLGHDHPLGAVDDESPARGHQRKFAQEHGLGLNFAGFVGNKFGGAIGSSI